MDKATPDLVDTLHGLSMQILVRLSADLAALETLASTDEAAPDRKASAALFYHSARKGCAQILTLASDAALAVDDLNRLRLTQTPVVEEYAGQPNLATGIAYAVRLLAPEAVGNLTTQE